MPLNTGDRAEVGRDVADRLYRRSTATLTTTQLRAAVDSVDDWVDANAAGAVASLPAEFRAETTVAQQRRVVAMVFRKRFGD